MALTLTIRNALALSAALLLVACAALPRMAAGPITVKSVMTVTSDGAWNKLEFAGRGPGENWTSDGLTLDVLSFFVGLKEGDALAPPPTGSARKPPVFRASMLPNEIVEFYEATVTQDGSTFRLERLVPAPFAGAPGFRFDFSGTRKNDDVALRGFGHGAVIKDRLYLITFRAPRIHYYPKHLPRAEATAKSALLKL